VLTTVYLDDAALFKANKVENQVLKGRLPTKFELREAAVAEQSPHGCFCVGGLSTHLLCEVADTLGDWSMVWWLRGEPLTCRLTP
jgi:hypothetical protein